MVSSSEFAHRSRCYPNRTCYPHKFSTFKPLVFWDSLAYSTWFLSVSKLVLSICSKNIAHASVCAWRDFSSKIVHFSNRERFWPYYIQWRQKRGLSSELIFSKNKTYSRRSNKLLGTSLAIVSRLHFHPGVSLEWFVRQVSLSLSPSFLIEGSWRQCKNNSDYLCPSGTPVLLSRAKVPLYLMLFLEPESSSKLLLCVGLIVETNVALSNRRWPAFSCA